ncbi:MAPEG family-domain-containing protein [Lasiosphaeris hirsuta]|uniref:MAPEG family-domain-containing protein n=1 Tax=Lasiosphaeris hirsuta TaxID=260670 RepID=A0AA40DLE8_9PEZI|nr:MAPEG family-domain-containing protein [Lasiosphaeris hirsuta]
MTTRLGPNHVGIISPLLPITSSFVLPFTAYFALLSVRVIRRRLQDKVYLGDGPPPLENLASPSVVDNALFVANRCHANFVEHFPMALLLAAAAELNDAGRRSLTAALDVLLAARVAHVDLGLRRPGAAGMGRAFGFYGTMGSMAFLSGYAGWLVKGYWGFRLRLCV